MARGGGNAPTNITWVICLILYIVALAGHFGHVHAITPVIALWSWIIGFGLLLVACRVRGL
jgi:hypothetical protein